MKKTKFPTPRPSAPTMAPTFNSSDTIGSGAMFVANEVFSASWVTDFKFLPDGKRILYIEGYSGRINVYDMITMKTKTLYTVKDVGTGGEVNICLGLAYMMEEMSGGEWVYAYCTRLGMNQLIRLSWDAKKDTLKMVDIIWHDKAEFDNGGHLAFHDGKLYLSVGYGAGEEPEDFENSQNLTAHNNKGKILRMNWNGTVPEDNPWEGSLNWAYGIKNCYGFANDPKTGMMWGSENGLQCNDEVNMYMKGSNYGFGPKAKCPKTNNSGPKIRLPKYLYKKPVGGFVGVAFDDMDNLLVGKFGESSIDCFSLDKKRTAVKKFVRDAYVQPPGPNNILSLERNPVTHDVYVGTMSGMIRLQRK